MEQHYFSCICSDFGHTVRFVFDPSDGELWLETHLYNWFPWYKRLWAATLYVFKKHRPYGHYDCTILVPDDFARLHDLLDRAQLFHSQQAIAAALKSRQEKPLLKG
jgi:hypothetical protein